MNCSKCGMVDIKRPETGLCFVCIEEGKRCDICKEQVNPPEYVWINASRGVKGHKSCIDPEWYGIEATSTPVTYEVKKTYKVKELDTTIDGLQREVIERIERLVSEHFEKAKCELLESLFRNMYTKGGADYGK